LSKISRLVTHRPTVSDFSVHSVHGVCGRSVKDVYSSKANTTRQHETIAKCHRETSGGKFIKSKQLWSI